MAEKVRRKKNDTGSDVKDVERDAGYATGYETDVASTSAKSSRSKLKKKKLRKAAGDGYETDDGYMSTSTKAPPLRKSKSKTRFFKLGNRSKPSIDDDETVQSPVETPPVPPTPAFRLPIAARFATTLNLDLENAVLDPPIGPLGMTRIASPVTAGTPSIVASRSNVTPNDDMESSVGVSAPSIASATASSKRGIIRFASDSSDNHGTTGSSNGHSLLSRFTTASSSSASTMGSMTPPTVKSYNISYPLTRSPSPPSPPLYAQPIVMPTPSRSNTKRAPRPLLLNSAPSDQEKLASYSHFRNGSPSEWSVSPTGSPFVVVTPNTGSSNSPSAPGSLPGLTSTASDRSTNTATRLHLPPRLDRARDVSPARSVIDVIPSTEFVVPSPSNELFVPPTSLAYYDLPPPSPPPTTPLPELPTLVGQQRSRSKFDSPQRSRLDIIQSASPADGPKRGRVSPFPTRPVPSNGLTRVPSRGFEGRVHVKRYRGIYAMPSPVGGWPTKDSGYASSPETSNSQRHARQSTRVGINIEQPSDDEEDYDEEEDLRDVLRGFTDDGRSASELGYQQGLEPEAALDRRRSLEALQNYYNNNAYDASRIRTRQSPVPERSPRPSFSPNASEDDLSDDKSRYTSDEKHSMYKMNNSSQARSVASGWADDRWSMSVDGESRASFMDADRSEEARERFIKRIEAMFDENGRELPPNLGIGKNAVIPPVPRLPQGLKNSSSTWI